MEKTSGNISIFVSAIRLIFWLSVYTLIAFVFVYLSTSFPQNEASPAAVVVSKYPTVIIDAGHGGFDGGAVSGNGIVEKDINLGICKKIAGLFELSDVECVMTRTEDVELKPNMSISSSKKRADLLARVEIAKTYDDAIFVSVHQNKFPSSKLRGLQVFYSKNNSSCVELAEIIKQNNRTMLDSENKRECKPAGREIFVLDSLSIPAVLIECGFLSNISEAEKLSDEEYQKQLALMIYSSVMQYININYSQGV